MGVLAGARDYATTLECFHRHGISGTGWLGMTTDPDEGRRQIEAMQLPAVKVGDVVRLRAGGDRVMTVLSLEDYGNMAVCEWQVHEGALAQAERDMFPVTSLVKVADGEQASSGP